MKLYLERSRECALSAALYAGQSGWKVLQKDIAHWLYHIIPHLARVWRFTIGIRGEGMQTKELLAPLLEVSVPSLQRLEILHWPHGRTWEDPAHVVDVFWSAPRLTSLRMVGAILGLPVPSWVHSLTRLELRKADSGEFLAAIASQCLSLIHLHVELEDLLPSGQFHVPSIQSLYIGICPHGDEHYLSCLPRATFPALTSLTFVHGSCVYAEPLTAAPAFLPPLRLFPALTSLSLIEQCHAANLVKGILGSPWVLLRTLTLAPGVHRFNAVPGVYVALRDAVRLRRPGAEALPKLRLSAPLLSRMEKGDAIERAVDMELFDPSELLAFAEFNIALPARRMYTRRVV